MPSFRPLPFLPLSLALLLIATPLLAQSRVWRAIGPAGGEPPADLVAHPAPPGVIYAPAAYGLLQSTDTGNSWTYVYYARTRRLQRVTINPASPATIVAGGTDGVIRSTDAGATWQVLSTEMADALAFAADGTLFAGLSESGVMKSSDSGSTWVAARAGLPDPRVSQFVIDARTPAAVYATAASALFRWNASGARWDQVGRVGSNTITAIDLTPAGVFYAADAQGIARSTDGGRTWTRVNGGLPQDYVVNGSDFVTDFAVGEAGLVYAALFYEGIYRSSDGMSWQPAGDPARNQLTSALLISGGSLMAASRPDSIARSEDGGATWQPSNRGFSDHDIRALAFSGSSLYAGSFSAQGLFSTPNDGANWTSIQGLPTSPVMSLAVWPVDPSIVYVGTGGAGVWRTSDGGASWQSALFATIHDLAIDPANPATAWAVSAGGSVYRTTSGGATWSDIGSSFPFSVVLSLRQIAADPAHAEVVFLGADKIYVSRDSGTTWSPLAATIKRPIAVAGPSVYAFVEGRIARTGDAAATWTPAAPPLPSSVATLPPDALAVDASSGDVYVAYTDTTKAPYVSIVLRSPAGGAWETLPSFGDGTASVLLARNGVLYAGTTLRGVFRIAFGAEPRRRAVKR